MSTKSWADLNAPAGYRWTDDEVRFEKHQSYIDGWIHGLWVGLAVFLVVWLLVAAVSS